MLERDFQAGVVKDLENKILPGCICYVNDGNYIQGFPDITIFYGEKWAALECKKSATEHHQPNQDYYVSLMNRMSFARFIYPENKDEVYHDLQQALLV